MASTREYLLFVLDLLRNVNGITCKKMMGEYILYKNGIIFGGVYDNRFLIKKTNSIVDKGFRSQIPYPDAKEMFLLDIENADEIKKIVELVYNDLK